MKTRYLIPALSVIALVSCKNELQPQDSSTAQEVVAPGANAQTQPQQALPADAQPMQPVVQPGQIAQAPATVAKGMNPPHGQPGHRCDIAVGAPLNSAPAKPAAAQQFTVTPAQTGAAKVTEVTPNNVPALLSTTPSQTTTTAPGMNPPHGQEGHRCDIAVGAPLNSATKATETKTDETAAPTETKQE